MRFFQSFATMKFFLGIRNMKNIRRNFSVPRTRRRKSFVCSVYWIMFPNCCDLRKKRMIQMTVSKPLIGWMKHNKLSHWPKKTLKIFVRLPGEKQELTKISYIFNFNFYFICCNFAHIYGLQTRRNALNVFIFYSMIYCQA